MSPQGIVHLFNRKVVYIKTKIVYSYMLILRTGVVPIVLHCNTLF